MIKEFKVNNFDFLRIFAASEVLLLHSFTHLKIPFPEWFKVVSLFPGVPMFFVMSGFLISASFERNNNLRNYFRNRFLRIYPALWICVIITVLVIYSVSGINFINWAGLKWFIAQLVGFIYTPNFLKNYGFGSYNGSLWTIPIEIQFYIILPFVYFLSSKFRNSEKNQIPLFSTIFIFFSCIGFFILLYFVPLREINETRVEKLLRYSFLPHIYLFFLGVLMQKINIYKSSVIYNKGFYWVIAYLMFCFLAPDSVIFIFIQKIFLAICTISLAYTIPEASHKILKGNDISYGVYIYHGLILGVLVQLNYTGKFSFLFVVIFLTYLLALLSWQFIEKPFLRRKSHVR